MKTMLKVICLFILSSSAFAINDKCVRLDDITVSVSGTAANIPNDCYGASALISYEISGSPATMSIVLQGCSRTGICTTLSTSTGTTTNNIKPSIDAIYDYFTATPTWTGGTSPKVIVHSTVTTASLVSTSTTQNVNCVSGCSGSNPNGQALMANSAPVAIASNQSAVPVSLASAPSTPVTNAGLSNIDVALSTRTKPSDQQHTILDSGNVNTQPAGFASIVSFQQAVTASAVVLATNAVHGFCVKALTNNALTVYVGPSGVSTATGYPLAAGESICYQGSNTNIAFVISSNTGSSVAVSGN